MERDRGLDYLFSLHGAVVYRDDGYWWKVEVWEVAPTPFIPQKGCYSGRLVYDHVHRTPHDKGYPYTFVSAVYLIEDFLLKSMKSSRNERTEVK